MKIQKYGTDTNSVTSLTLSFQFNHHLKEESNDYLKWTLVWLLPHVWIFEHAIDWIYSVIYDIDQSCAFFIYRNPLEDTLWLKIKQWKVNQSYYFYVSKFWCLK